MIYPKLRATFARPPRRAPTSGDKGTSSSCLQAHSGSRIYRADAGARMQLLTPTVRRLISTSRFFSRLRVGGGWYVQDHLQRPHHVPAPPAARLGARFSRIRLPAGTRVLCFGRVARTRAQRGRQQVRSCLGRHRSPRATTGSGPGADDRCRHSARDLGTPPSRLTMPPDVAPESTAMRVALWRALHLEADAPLQALSGLAHKGVAGTPFQGYHSVSRISG